MFTSRLRQARLEKGYSQRALAEKLHISQQAYAKYETGASSPNPEMLGQIASLLNVSADSLLGTAHLLTKRTIPVLGSIPAGVPIEAIEDILDYEDLSPEEAGDGYEYFGLRIRGRSMMPEYLDGDTIIVRRQESAETGDDAVVMVNGDDATFKRIQRGLGGVTLMPLNTAEFTPTFFTNAEIAALPVRILGICVELRRKKK